MQFFEVWTRIEKLKPFFQVDSSVSFENCDFIEYTATAYVVFFDVVK